MRKRFTPEEREAFTVGTVVEWRNGSHWHPGRITQPIVRDSDGFDSLGLVHTGASTRTVSTGRYLTGTPTYVRLPIRNG